MRWVGEVGGRGGRSGALGVEPSRPPTLPPVLNALPSSSARPELTASALQVRRLVAAGRSATEANECGERPLHYAVQAGRAEAALAVMAFLCEHGASVNDTAEDGETPLHYAARSGALEVCKRLVEAGASVTAATTATEEQPIHAAAER